METALIFDPKEAPLLEAQSEWNQHSVFKSKYPFVTGVMDAFKEPKLLILFLSDQQFKSIIPRITADGHTIALLPHPKNHEVCFGLGVDYNLSLAMAYLSEPRESVKVDLLFCNDRPVFNNLLIGDTFQIVTNRKAKAQKQTERIKEYINRFFNLRPFPVSIEVDSHKKIRTAVAGILVVQHGRSSLLSRLLVEGSHINDGRFHIFLISPRSLTGLMLFGIRSLYKPGQLPPFAAHIKTKAARIESAVPLEFSEDGRVHQESKIEISIEKRGLSLIPGKHLKAESVVNEPNDIYKVKELPLGDAATTLAGNKLPFLKKASTEEFKDLFVILRENAKLKGSFLVLMVLSTLLATLGLFANSSPVIIGAMILAPLMAPIISLSMATLRQDKNLALQSGWTIILGMIASFSVAVILTWITPIKVPNAEIAARIRPNLLDLGVAIVSGVAGAYAHAREEISKTLAGVAIAVALVPPLAVAAIGFGWFDWEVYSGATLLLLTNLVGMVLAGALTFLALGFSPVRRARKGLIISATLVGMLSIPLAIGFYRMVSEHRIIRKIDGKEYHQTLIKEVRVNRNKPLQISVKLVASTSLEELDIQLVKKAIEAEIGKPVELEITLALRK
jgi:uncharacterized hydrophobic protein (TIGR00271 family)